MTDNASRPDRTWLYVGLVFLAFWFVYLRFYNPLRHGGSMLGGSNLGAADFSWKVQDLEGRPVDFSNYQGRTIFLNVWATWCGPCVKEMPSIARLAADPKLKGISFVCVSIDDSAETVKGFLKGKDWPMTILHSRAVPKVFETEGIPATFIIGPDGKIAASEVGSADWDTPEVVEFLTKLSGGSK